MSSLRLTNRAVSNSIKIVSRSIATKSTATLASRLAKPSVSLSSRLFSTSSIKQGSHKSEVQRFLQDELKHENESDTSFPEELTSFLESSGYEIVETEGQALGKIIKKSDKEIVHIFFDVNQIVNINPEEPQLNQSEEIEENFEDPYENSYINLNVVVENPSIKKAVAFDVLLGADEGSLFIENVTSYENAAEALNESSEADHKRELNYNGPDFSNLDETLQSSFENFLESRGIDDVLYNFILQYGIYKENKEYLAWLEKLNNFFKN
ncbi:hypothetical protein WICMUC_003147 [Wickerhamomyces mucosus]|uniref:Mitochondrial acidic protein MAM33 n=1 Tax=Wickerhamomyces mucosus TaxID=1378264 RepID=A0A9P8TDS0_9ASCO|nr:hypothetical protein WICMUC_003147 [Wickerhamomyces mucosus]